MDVHTSHERCFGLVGRKLGHSYSPRIHAQLSEVPYRLFEVEPKDLAALVREDTSWRGLNVTIPYKQDVLELVDEVSEAGERLGAVNTLVRREDGSVFADNTDLVGFARMLDDFRRATYGEAGSLSGCKALVLGSGGASKAVVAALEDAGATPVVISRSGSETYETLTARHADATLLVNTTPVGMYPDCPASPLSANDLAALPRLKGVLDIIYNPTRTRLCYLAEEAKVPYVQSGLTMLVAQAHRSSELFQNTTIDASEIERITSRLMREVTNICLIGMPGAGKTSTGKRLARLVGRPFVDLDNAVEISCGITPAQYIVEHGENAFRAVETEEVARYGRESGLVIACGGGVVTCPENYELLHQNGQIVMIDRPLDELSTKNRPVTSAKGIERLASERMDLYRGWADYILSCSGTADQDAAQLKDVFGL